ncbi:MAG: DUF2949 domain-containing protein [Phormidesmis sp.]
MKKTTFTQFLQYLQDELAISRASIEEALQQLGQDTYLLPIALWQYGLLTLKQLDQVYDWLAMARQEQEG